MLGFGAPLLTHIAHTLAVERGPVGCGPASVARHAAMHQRLRPLLAESVADALRAADGRRATGRRAGAPSVPVDLLAAHVADTFLRVLAWWVERGAPGSAREADRLFRALVAPAVADAVG